MYVYRVSVAALIVALVVAKSTNDDATTTEDPQFADDISKARRFLKKVDAELEEWYNKQSIAEWNYASNLTEENLATKLNVSVAMTSILKRISKESLTFLLTNTKDEDITRQLQKLSTLGAPMLSEEVKIDI